MLAKLTSKNQLTLPKAAVQALGPVEYFDVRVRKGQIVLTRVRMQRGDAVRWLRQTREATHVAEPDASSHVSADS